MTGWQHCRCPVSVGSMRTHLGFNPERSGGAALTVMYRHYLAQSTGAGDGSFRQTLDERSSANCPAILGWQLWTLLRSATRRPCADRPARGGCVMSALPAIRWFGDDFSELMDLARLLYDEMERLDPDPVAVAFDDLPFLDQEIYRCAAK